MAFEQNPYAVKISLTADNSLASTITNGSVSSSAQFKFVKIAGKTATITGNVVSGTTSITGVSSLVGLVTGASVAGTGIPTGAFITNIAINGTTYSINISTPATSAQSSCTLTVIPSSQPYQNGPVATAVSASTDRPIGILQNQPITKLNATSAVEGFSEAEITVSGVSKVISGGVVTAGDAITIDSQGRAVTATFASSTTYAPNSYFVLGTALTPSTGAGDVITVAVATAAAGRVA
jgi:hypothetical protein